MTVRARQTTVNPVVVESSTAFNARHAQVWAEGTDAQVAELGGEHSAKGWNDIMAHQTFTWGNIYGTLSDQTDLKNALDAKQDVISDLSTIRSGAEAGATAVQPATLSTELSAYRTSAAQDIIDSGKQATLVSGTNIKTVNNNSLLGSGNITIDDLPSQTGHSGEYLTTNGSTASWTDLSGKADADLSNCTRPYVTETYSNGASWYRVWSDGWCEEGGETANSFSATNSTISFLKTYASAPQVYMQMITTTSTDAGYATYQVKEVGTGSFTTYWTCHAFWRAEGYL